jgi:hypothetical protein
MVNKGFHRRAQEQKLCCFLCELNENTPDQPKGRAILLESMDRRVPVILISSGGRDADGFWKWFSHLKNRQKKMRQTSPT